VLARVARALGSPLGIAIAIPILVVATGLQIFLIGRSATSSASDDLVRRQLAEQAIQIERDVAFALDQCDPMLGSLRALSLEGRTIDTIGPRLHDLASGRAGVKYTSISYPAGRFQGAYRADSGRIEVTESLAPTAAEPGRSRRWSVERGALVQFLDEESTYDPRKRDFYQLAIEKKRRVWTRPYTFYRTHETGITCAEPVFFDDGGLAAVITVDFDMSTMSSFVARSPIEGARTVVYAADGTVLAYPAAAERLAALPAREGQVLHHDDIDDPALDALFAALGRDAVTEQRFLAPGGGAYLASVAPIGGERAKTDVAFAWYVATLVPSSSLLGPVRTLEEQSAIASVLSLIGAAVLALALVWNAVRMRRQVAESRARAASAEARARELGSYRLVGKMGTGGMGEVWRAEHRLLAREAAIKLMRADKKLTARETEEARERFRREAQTIAQLRSRHTIEIFDYGVTDDDGTFFYVMELLDGLDIDSLVQRHGAQPAARVIPMLIQACSSLGEAHAAGLLHRDVKPANLFACRVADELDVIKVLDFGIVHAIGMPSTSGIPAVVVPQAGPPRSEPMKSSTPATGPRLTEMGMILGTVGYMSPEQARGLPLDGRSDLYALGCVAWLLLTGSEVYERSSTPEATLFQHVCEPVPSLRRRVPGWLPAELEKAVFACLSKDAIDRPATAQILADMLRAVDVPAQHAWTRARATAWWSEHRPAVERVSATDATDVRVIVPVATDPTVAATPTVVGKTPDVAARS
jgi:serine/threonine protein kinase